MHCEQIPEQFADYVAGTLSAAERVTIERHLTGCADCRTALEVWNRLGDLALERPSPELRGRFQDMLWTNAAAGRFVRPAPVQRPVWTWAAAAALLIGGWLGGRYAPWPPAGDSSAPKSDEVATLRKEVSNLREAVVVSMLGQQSSSDRLKGVLTSSTIERPDPNVVTALIDTLRHDPSINVRLSAVDALKRFASQQNVRSGFVDTLSASDSPLVQIALIDALVESRDTRAVGAIRQLQSDAQVDKVVKQRAKLALERLSPRSE